MPNLTITIPAPLVADLTTIAGELLAARNINSSGWTTTQVGQRFIAELLKDQIVNYRLGVADTAGAATVKTARDAAATAVSDAQAAAVTAAAGITG